MGDSELQVMEDYGALCLRQLARHDRNIARRIGLVARFKTPKFIGQLKDLMREAGAHSAEFVRDTGKGKRQKSEYPAIKWEWVDQYENGGYTGDSFAGFIYIELRKNRYLRLQYAM